MKPQKALVIAGIAMLIPQLSGCTVMAVAGAAVTVGATAVSVGATAVNIGAKAVGAAVDLAIPDSDKKKEDK